MEGGRRRAAAESGGLAIAAAEAMHGQRADGVTILDLRGLVDYADYFVVASVAGAMRVRGVAGAVGRTLDRAGGRRLNQPDRRTGWSLLDYGDVIVHIFDHEARDYYRIEDLWGDAPRIEWPARPGAGTGAVHAEN